MLTNVRCTTWLCGSIIYWQRCSRWNWWGRSSGAVPDWRRSDRMCPLLYAWIWPAQIGVGEASMQARRQARRVQWECQGDAESNLRRARNCWKIGNAVLHLHTNKCVHCMVLCLWAPDLWERICARRCNKDWGSNEWRVFTSFAPKPCKIDFLPFLQPKPGVSDVAIKSSKLEFWLWLQPKPGADGLAIKSSKLEFWL